MTTARILVVDDEYGVRSGIRQILEIEGYGVDEAATGEEALTLLHANEYDVAFLDYRLPDIDGLTILQDIKSKGLDLMTCMITAYANIDTAIAATRQGVDFFLPKPFLPDDLLGVADTLVRHKLARTEAERLRREHAASLLELAEEKTRPLAGLFLARRGSRGQPRWNGGAGQPSHDLAPRRPRGSGAAAPCRRTAA